MRRRTVLALLAAVGLAAFAFGRSTAPQPEVLLEEKAAETTAATAIATSSVAETALTATAAETNRQEARVVYRDRWYRVDGSIEREREVEASQLAERRTEQTAGHVHREEQEARVERVEVVREVERRVEVQPDRPRWLIGALGAVGLDGELSYGPQVHYRIGGPFHVSGALLIGADAPVGVVGMSVAF